MAERYNMRRLSDHEIKTRPRPRTPFTRETWDKPCCALSGGERMRLMLCCLTIADHTPDMFVLDEPTNNLDIDSIAILTDTIRNYRGIAARHLARRELRRRNRSDANHRTALTVGLPDHPSAARYDRRLPVKRRGETIGRTLGVLPIAERRGAAVECRFSRKIACNVLQSQKLEYLCALLCKNN